MCHRLPAAYGQGGGIHAIGYARSRFAAIFDDRL